MLLGGILTAMLAAGCFGGGPGYSTNPYGYNSSYSSYGNSYPYSGYTVVTCEKRVDVLCLKTSSGMTRSLEVC